MIFLFILFIFSTAGEQENIDKFSKRLVKVTRQHNDDCKKLLTLMGVPYIEASIRLAFFDKASPFQSNRFWEKQKTNNGPGAQQRLLS